MIIDIALIVFLLAFVLWGTMRGMARMIFSAVSSILALVAGYVLYKPISSILEKLEVADGLAGKMAENGIIERLPGIMRDLPMVSSAVDEMYRSVAVAAVGVMSFVAVVIVVKVVLFLISAIIGLASNLPVIHQANGLGGGLIGFGIGIVFALLIFTVLSALEAFGKIDVMSTWLDGSYIASLIYNNNPLLGTLIN